MTQISYVFQNINIFILSLVLGTGSALLVPTSPCISVFTQDSFAKFLQIKKNRKLNFLRHFDFLRPVLVQVDLLAEH